MWWNWHINGLKCNINGYDFSKISCVETEFGLDKPVNAEFAFTKQNNLQNNYEKLGK